MTGKKLGIYVHIPFCRHKCGYCDFCSHPPVDDEEIEAYCNALLLNISDFSGAAKKYTVDTVYFGGGTPTVLPVKKLTELLCCIHDNYKVARDAEITLEANPGTVTPESLRALRCAGFNRLSVGLQSAEDTELYALGRIHSAEMFADCFRGARAAGFDNINVDLMYGIPYQTLDSFRRSLHFVKKLAPEHISVYGLKIEEGTPFYKQRDSLPLPDEETEYKMYILAHTYLTERGYGHYEISNFSRPGLQARHNTRYWTCGEYLGFGVAAHSYFGGQRYAYTENIAAYIREMETPTDLSSILSECTDIDERAGETEYVMLHLRLFAGLSLADYRTVFGRDFTERYGEKLRPYVEGGFVRLDETHCAFTVKGMYVSNTVLADILEF